MSVVPAQLATARQWAGQVVFTDTLRIVRDQPGLVQTDHLGTETPMVETVHTGPGLVQAVTSLRTDVMITSGEQEADTTGYVVKVPIDVDLREGDYVTVTASQTTPVHVGRWWKVTSVPSQGWQLLRRCPIDLTARPQFDDGPEAPGE